MRTCALLLSLALCGISSAVTDSSPGEYARWAILASPRLEEAGLVDLLTVSLSGQMDVQLVEREQIAAANRELTLANALGADAAGERLRLGRLLKADALLLLAAERRDNEEFVRVVISDCRCGARLWTDCLPFSRENGEETVGQIVALVDTLRRRYPDGVERIAGVPPFVSKNLEHDYDHLQEQFAYVLESALAAYPGTAVLEIEEIRAMQRELALTGGSVADRIMPLFIEGEFRVTEGGQRKGSVHMKLRSTGGDGAERLIERDLPTISAVVEYLRGQFPAEMMKPTPAQIQRALSVDEQVALLSARADAFVRLGSLLKPANLREAALLIKPDDSEQIQLLINTYRRFPIYKNRVNWSVVDGEGAAQDWRLRLGGWRRAFQLLEYLVRNELATQHRILGLEDGLSRAIDKFIFRVPDTDEERSWSDPSITAVLEEELARCTEVHRAFVREVIPLLGRQRDRGPIKRPPSVSSTWVDHLLAFPTYRPVFGAPPYTQEHLKHYLHVLSEVVPDQPLRSHELLRIIKDLTMDSAAPRTFGDDELLKFLRELERSPRQTSRFYGRLGLLLFDCSLGRDGEKPGPVEALGRLDVWEQEIRAERELRSKSDFLFALRRIRKELASRAGDGRAGPLRQQSPSADVAQGPELVFRRTEITVRRISGELIPLADSEWSGKAGWFHSFGTPHTVIPAEPAFDILWNNKCIFLHREPSILDEMCIRDDEHVFVDVHYDGKHIWVMSCCLGVSVFSTNGTLLAEAGPKQGLPAANEGGRLHAIAPGRVVAVGSFRPNKRAWFANLTLENNSVDIDVFHEATLVSVGADSDKTDRRDPRLTFVPQWIYAVPNPDGGANPTLIVSQGPRDYLHRRIDLDRRDVTVVNFGAACFQSVGTRRIHYVLDNGDALVAYANAVKHWSASEDPAKRGRTTTLLTRPETRFFGQMFRYGEHVYAPGNRWARVHPRTLAVEELQHEPPSKEFSRWRWWYGLSSHYGLVAWNQIGQFYQVNVGSTAARPDVTETRGGDAVLVAPLRPLARAVYVFKNGSSAESVGGIWGNQLRSFPQAPSLDFFPLAGGTRVEERIGRRSLVAGRGCVTAAARQQGGDDSGRTTHRPEFR